MIETIQDYTIKSLIREDVMGAVYLGVHWPTNTKVAIRLIDPSFIDKLFDYNLYKKQHALLSLDHPSIGKFYQCIKQAEQVFVISEYIPNATTLLQYLAAEKEPATEEKIWYIFKQIIDAFDYAHSKGINHFAIHPENICILADQVKMLDFGIASLFINHVNKSLPEKLELYNVQYRSPEHVLNKGLDLRSDIYSLGVLLFELLTRQSPYPSAGLSEINDKILNHPLPEIKIYTEVFAHSYTMQAIVNKATAKNPSQRFTDFRELKESLLKEKTTREKNVSRQLRQQGNAGKQFSSSENVFMSQPAKQKKRRKRTAQALLLVGLMAGAITIGVNFNHPSISKLGTTLNEQINSMKTIGSGATDESKREKYADDSNEGLPSTDSEQKSSPDKKAAPDVKKSTASSKVSKPTAVETTIAHAGSSSAAKPVNSFSQVELQDRVESFYEALSAKDTSRLNGYYAPVLTRFFNEHNVDQKQLHNLLQTAWKRTPEDTYEILWDTFKYVQDRKGNYTIEFYMNYVYRRANTNSWRSQKIHTMIKMDNNLQIFYMSGD